jgi:hypothetical protein
MTIEETSEEEKRTSRTGISYSNSTISAYSHIKMLEQVHRGLPDPMFFVKEMADSDNAKEKVDLGVGIYRNEAGKYQEFEVIKKVGTLMM